MSLAGGLAAREASGRPVGVALVGAGAFGRMVLHQAVRTRGLAVRVVADRDPARARAALELAGADRAATAVTADAAEAIALDGVEVVVEATGDAAAGPRHALLCAAHGRHVVMVTVEADALVGPLLARRCREAGVVYTLAYGDQPALICELVDWARTAGFEVECAGKGTRYLPAFHAVDAGDGVGPLRARSGARAPGRLRRAHVHDVPRRHQVGHRDGRGGQRHGPGGARRPRLPAGGGGGAADGLPAAGRRRRAAAGRGGGSGLRPAARRLGRSTTTCAGASSWWCAPAPTRCAAGSATTAWSRARDREHAALWRPSHLIGLEAGVSIASAALRGEATGEPEALRADVVAVAKRDLPAGTVLDGEGGTDVWGRLVPAGRSLPDGLLPIALAGEAVLARDVRAGDEVGVADLTAPPAGELAALRAELVAAAAPGP